jgi:hypothetical protein
LVSYVVWVLDEYRGADGRIASRIFGFAATGTGSASLHNLPAVQSGIPQTLAIGGGTLIGYRVAGT